MLDSIILINCNLICEFIKEAAKIFRRHKFLVRNLVFILYYPTSVTNYMVKISLLSVGTLMKYLSKITSLNNFTSFCVTVFHMAHR